MNGALKYTAGHRHSDPENTRIALAKRAILMLLDKMAPEDVFSLVIFHNTARTIIDSEFVKNLDRKKVDELINSKFISGGTTISSGF